MNGECRMRHCHNRATNVYLVPLVRLTKDGKMYSEVEVCADCLVQLEATREVYRERVEAMEAQLA